MTLIDHVQITINSGKGGDGNMSGRKEAGVPHGWPSGGDWGRGGDVIFQASEDLNTLINYRYNKHFAADPGEDGRTKDQYGAHGESIILKVPVGTVVKSAQTGHILHQFLHHGETYIAATWWTGWAGNIHFKNAVNQFPQFALLGEPGEIKEVELELQLLADVWLIGAPSVGKSTLINSVSNVKAKTADYHFTTLVPNMGQIAHDGYSFIMIDIPGLIEWASQGKWLGNEFLRHVLKAKIFCFLCAIDQYEQGITDMLGVIEEVLLYCQSKFIWSTEFGYEIRETSFSLAVHDHGAITLTVHAHDETWTSHILFEKILHLVLNKYDLVPDDEVAQELTQAALDGINELLHKYTKVSLSDKDWKKSIHVLSAATHHHIEERLDSLVEHINSSDIVSHATYDEQAIHHETIEPIVDVTDAEKQTLIDKSYLDPVAAKHAKVRAISHHEICRLVFTLPRGNDEAELWFWGVMDKWLHLHHFEQAGIVPWDVLKIISMYEWNNDKYILYGQK